MMINKKISAKIVSLILSIMLIISAMPTVMVSAEAFGMMITAENFTLSGDFSAVVTEGLNNKLYQNVVKVQRLDAVSTKFYIEAEGEYSVHFLTGSAASDTGRYPVVTVDDNESINLAHSQDMTWEKITCTFDAGWHTISLTTSEMWKPYFVDAIYVTNDASIEITVDNDNDKFGAYVPDTTAPVIGDADIVTEFDGNVCTATFPQATGDEGEAIIYEYKIGDSSTVISDITVPVNVGELSGETTITFTASDIFGNSDSKSVTVTAPSTGGDNPPAGEDPAPQDKPMMITAENFVLSGDYSVIDTTGVTDKLYQKSVKVQRFDAVTTRFYIEEAGVYTMQFLTGSASDDSGRYAVVTVDEDESINLAHSNSMIWEKITYAFVEGWHTVSLTTSDTWKPYFINALYITDDVNDVLTVDNDNEKFGDYVPDTTAPVISDADIVTEFDGNVCTATFPQATSADGGKIIYEYKIGDNSTVISDITVPVNVGELSGENTITFTASDIFGNSDTKSVTVTAPSTGGDNPPEGGDNPPEGGDTPPAEDTVSRILLSGENFDIPDYGSGNGLSANGGTATGNLFANSVKIAGADASRYITAQVYIATAGTYNLWVLSANELPETNVSFASRLATAGFDGEFQSCTPHMVHQWESSQWELTEGWHTVNVGMKNSWGNVKVNAVYITNDLELVLNTTSDDSLISYHDIAAPQFASQDASVTYTDATTCTLTFPATTDDKAVVKTVYYVNGNQVDAEGGSVTLTGLKPLEKVTLKSEAFDTAGNKGVLNCEYIASPVKVAGFSMKKGTGILEDTSSLSAGDVVTVNTAISNHTGDLRNVELSLCVYSANYERLLMCTIAQASLAANAGDTPTTVSLTLPAGFDSSCIIAATAWDKTTGEPYITGIEIKGAAQ